MQSFGHLFKTEEAKKQRSNFTANEVELFAILKITGFVGEAVSSSQVRSGTGTEIPAKSQLLQLIPAKSLAAAQCAADTDMVGSPSSCSCCLEERCRSWSLPGFPGVEEALSASHGSVRFLSSLHAKLCWYRAREDAAFSKAGTECWLSATGFVLIKEESIRRQDIQPPGASDYFFLLLLFFSLMCCCCLQGSHE